MTGPKRTGCRRFAAQYPAVSSRPSSSSPLTVERIFLSNNSEEEFQADPLGTVNRELLPGETLAIAVVHTPTDPIPDQGSIEVLHSADPDALFTITLNAEFKEEAALSVTDDGATLSPNLDVIDFGALPIGDSLEIDLFLRNAGALGSILTIDELDNSSEK